jgi:hypothetical protein
MSLHPVDLAIIGVYLFLMAMVGFAGFPSRKYVK